MGVFEVNGREGVQCSEKRVARDWNILASDMMLYCFRSDLRLILNLWPRVSCVAGE